MNGLWQLTSVITTPCCNLCHQREIISIVKRSPFLFQAGICGDMLFSWSNVFPFLIMTLAGQSALCLSFKVWMEKRWNAVNFCVVFVISNPSLFCVLQNGWRERRSLLPMVKLARRMAVTREHGKLTLSSSPGNRRSVRPPGKLCW